MVVVAPKSRPRTKAQIDQGHQVRLEKAQREIDELAAEFQVRLPKNQATSIGAIYARYSTRHQDSIADQVRTMLEEAAAQGIFVPRQFIFFDLAVRGYTRQREGLQQLQLSLKNGEVDVLLLFATN